MGYYADLIKQKQNAKEEKDNDMDQFVKGLRKKELERAGFDKKSISYLTKKNGEEKDNGLVKSEVYKGYTIDVSSMVEKGKVVGYEVHIADKNYKQVGWELWFKTQEEAIKWGKSKIDSGKFNSTEEKGYYAKLAEEKAAKKNAEEKKTFKVMGEEFDISTIGGVKKAADAIERHFKRKRDELGLPSAEEWKSKIGHELLLASRNR